MSGSPEVSRTAVLSKITRRIVPFMFFLYVLAYLDRVNVGFAALQMKDQLGFSDAVYGLGAGIFFVSYFLFEVPSNLIMQRVGARLWIARIMVTWGVVSACMMFVRTPFQFYTVRFLLGVAEAGFFPGVILYFTYWFPADVRARTIAGFMTAPAVSAIVGGPISGLLLEMHGMGGLAGWQWLFLLEGIPSFLVGFVVLLKVTDTPQQAAWLTAEEKRWLQETLDQERSLAQSAYGGHGLASLRSLLDFRVLLCSMIYFALTMIFHGLGLWLPQILKNASGASNLGVGLLITIPYAAACIAMVVWGAHSDKTGERRWHVTLAAWVSAVGLVFAAYVSNPALSLACFSVATAGLYSMLGPFWAIPSAMLTGTAAAGGIALINSVGNLGGFFGPYAIGYLKTSYGSFTGGVLVLAASAIVCGALAQLVPERAVKQVNRVGDPAGRMPGGKTDEPSGSRRMVADVRPGPADSRE